MLQKFILLETISICGNIQGMKTSIIILTFNGLELNKKCIDSILQNTEGDFEIIVVDNDSQDGTVKYLKSLSDKQIRVIFNKENTGFARGNNQGAKRAIGDILVFLNNDTEVTRGWLLPLQNTLASKEISIAGPKLLYPDGKIQHAGVAFTDKGMPRHIYRRFDSNFPPANRKKEYQAVTGACLAIKKEIFDRVGGFDEKYINGLEDVDLCFKVRKSGFRVMYCPKSVVVHHESVGKDRFKYLYRNIEYYQSKWPNVKADEDDIYRRDGFGSLFILRQHISNRYLTGNYLAKTKTVLKKFLGRS